MPQPVLRWRGWPWQDKLTCSWPRSSTSSYPHYRALILRKTFADLSLPDAIMDRAISWWDGVEGARFNNQEKALLFPLWGEDHFWLSSQREGPPALPPREPVDRVRAKQFVGPVGN